MKWWMRSTLHGEHIKSSEAKILQKLNELQLEFQEGKRVAPAFSLVTAEDLDNNETWQHISKKLKTTKLKSETVVSNREFRRY